MTAQQQNVAWRSSSVGRSAWKTLTALLSRALHIKARIRRIPALLQEGSVIETAVEITRGEVRRPEFSKVPATSPRGIGKNTDAAALLKEGRTRPTRDSMCKALEQRTSSAGASGRCSHAT
jgi:hypothetical protein